MSLIDRYVYAVTRRLPQKQKSDIEKELRTLIDDMLEQQQEGISEDKKLENVLMELGDPELIADNYREAKRYLIGPQNFDNFIFVLKIVMGAVFLGITISTLIGSVFDAQQGIISIFAGYTANLAFALIQGFAWVTISFAIAEYNGFRPLNNKAAVKSWSIEALPVLPVKEAAISRVETAISILFSTIFISILFFAPQVFAAYVGNSSGGTAVIPVFNIEFLSRVKMIFVAIFVLSVFKEILKLYFGRWTLKLAIPVIVLSIISAIMSVSIFMNPNIWNVNFVAELASHLNISAPNINILGNVSTVFISILVFATIIEISTGLYKGIKFNK